MSADAPRLAAVEPDARRLAGVLAKGQASLDRADEDIDLLERHRVAAAVARRRMLADGAGAIASELRWHLHRSAARIAMMIDTLDRVGAALGGAGIQWAPIKGGDLAFRAYEFPEDREFADLDILIDEQDREAAASALRSSGWRTARERSPVMEEYLRQEGYCQAFAPPSGILVELHHRLWGAVPAGLAGEVMRDATPDPSLGPSGRRVSTAHAFAIAAFHIWTVDPPRAFSNWWDLGRLITVGGPTLAGEVGRIAGRWELQLPVGLAALVVATLWPDDALRGTAEELLRGLKTSERTLMNLCARKGSDAVPFWSMVLARLLAGRPSRHGWRSVWRRVSPHPAIRSAARRE